MNLFLVVFLLKNIPFSPFPPQKKNHPPPAVLYSGAQCPNDCRTSSGDTPESPGELPSGGKGPPVKRPKQQIPRSQEGQHVFCPRGAEFFSAFWWCKMVKRNDEDKILFKKIYIYIYTWIKSICPLGSRTLKISALQIPPLTWLVATFPPDRNQLLGWSSHFKKNISADPSRNTSSGRKKVTCFVPGVQKFQKMSTHTICEFAQKGMKIANAEKYTPIHHMNDRHISWLGLIPQRLPDWRSCR